MKTQYSIRPLVPRDEPELRRFLLPRIESSMFLLGNMQSAGLVDRGQPFEGSYVAAWEKADIVGVAAHYWNENVVLQAPLALVEDLARKAVSRSGRPVGGLIGPADQVEVAFNSLVIPPEAIEKDETEFLYSLDLADLATPENLAGGRWRARRMKVADLELCVAWRVAYSIEALDASETPELWQKSRESLQRSQEAGVSWVLEDNGNPVAMSSFNAVLDHAVQIGGVWTPPELRRRGYGRAVVAASLLDARAAGAELAVLFTGMTNFAAQKAYVALGFERIGDYRVLLLRRPGFVVPDAE